LSQDSTVTGAPPARSRQLPDRGARVVRVGQVGPDRVAVEVEVAGARVAVVAVLGDGERDDPRGRGGDLVEQLVGLAGGHERAAVDVDDVGPLPLGGQLQDRVQVVLGRQGVDDAATAVCDADDAPVASLGGDRLRGVDRGVGAVEAAQADVDDAGGVGRAGSDQGDGGEGAAVQGRHRSHQSRTEPSRRRAVGR
jgi:hypothetical protein